MLTAHFLIQRWQRRSQILAQSNSKLSKAKPNGKNITAGPGSKIKTKPTNKQINPKTVQSERFNFNSIIILVNYLIPLIKQF